MSQEALFPTNILDYDSNLIMQQKALFLPIAVIEKSIGQIDKNYQAQIKEAFSWKIPVPVHYPTILLDLRHYPKIASSSASQTRLFWEGLFGCLSYQSSKVTLEELVGST